jgi:adenylylsulfate kinase
MSQPKKNITWHGGYVSVAERETLLGQRGMTVWLTGLSGAGKSTVAFALERRMVADGRPCFVLDGDNVRHGLCKDLGFSAADRSENIRRVAEVARLMNDAGLIVITAFISPYRADRALAEQIIGSERLIGVHVSTPLATCEQRDPKGLYQRARAGDLPDFTGISAPYEPPASPDLSLNTALMDVDACVNAVITVMVKRAGADKSLADR